VNFHYKFLPSADGRGLNGSRARHGDVHHKVTHYESGKRS